MQPPRGMEDHPVRDVSYDDAERLAEWAGMHIPTEAEWEWAARGADARVFPWGDAWAADASRANWGGLVVDERHETTTLSVESLPAGLSWCGLHHMCGNVAEWTSSWFDLYPGCTAMRNSYAGKYVKVIRGGSAADGDAITLRSAARNFVGAGPAAPPYPENAFQFVGLRLASYAQPGLDHVGPIVRRATGGGLRRSALDADRFAAFVARTWARADQPVVDHVHVLGRSTAVVLVPVTYILRDDIGPSMAAAHARPSKWRTTAGFVARTSEREPEFAAGVLHTDLPLLGVDLRTPDDTSSTKSRRGQPKPPATRTGTLPGGTYLVVPWFGRVALTTPTFEFVAFLPEPEGKIPSVEVRPWSSERLGPPTLEDPHAVVWRLPEAVP